MAFKSIFDLLDFQFVPEFVGPLLDFDESDEEPFHSNFESMGVETTNIILNGEAIVVNFGVSIFLTLFIMTLTLINTRNRM